MTLRITATENITPLEADNLNDKLVRVVITAAGGTGGATAGTLSVQVSDLNGVAIARAVRLRLDISDTDGAGALDAAANATFDTATTGSYLVGSGGASAIVLTDATGLFEAATADASDETVYFSATTADGGFVSNAASCVVVECASASATWSA